MLAVAVVEDNEDLLDEILFNLDYYGFAVEGFSDGEALNAALDQGRRWPVLILDIELPGESGLDIAAHIVREYPETGIVVLTARGSLDDRISGLGSGVDHYLVKPVDYLELSLIVKALARRLSASRPGDDAWHLNTTTQKMTDPLGSSVELSLFETQVLAVLAARRPESASRDELIEAMGKSPDSYDPRALEVLISRLRAKLGEHCPIRSVRTKGYRFAGDVVVIK